MKLLPLLDEVCYYKIGCLNKETARCIGNKLSTIGRKAVFRDTQLNKTPVHMGGYLLSNGSCFLLFA